MKAKDIKSEVRKRYGAIARTGGCSPSGRCTGTETADCCAVGYGPVAQDVVKGADLGLGCGTPTLHVDIKPGETVLDLGSGAGVDVFLAARAVGPEGKVIGVDMTPEMIRRSRQNAAQAGYRNVEFRRGDLEALPVEDRSVDVVLSNCVINLVPDKRRAFAEMFRVLKRGGRFCVSDIVTRGNVPRGVRSDMRMWASCLGGAIDVDRYLRALREIGFEKIRIIHSTGFGPSPRGAYEFLSITVEGLKP
jgi:SAM-dependent methyltransferase